MIASRNDYKYVAGDLFARSAATNDYLVLIDGTSLYSRPSSLVRGEDFCWIWECINTRRVAFFTGGDPFVSYAIPYQFRRVPERVAFGDANVIDRMVSAFNELLLLVSSRTFTLDPAFLSQTIWHHQNRVPDAIFLPDINDFIVSMPQRYSCRHTPYDVWSAMADMERFMSPLKYVYRDPFDGDWDWSSFTPRATVTPVNYPDPPSEAEIERDFSSCVLAYSCQGWGSYDRTTNPGYWYATVAADGAIRISLPNLEHVKAVYPVYKLHIFSSYFAGGMNPTINESAGMYSYVVSTTPCTMDANHTVEISPSQEIVQACPLSTLNSELNLQHGFTQDTPSSGSSFDVSWYIRITNVSLIIELDDSVANAY